MKFFLSIVLIAILSAAACIYLPWWSIALAAFAASAAIPQKPVQAFAAGFIALFLLWGLLSWYISSNNSHLLAHKVSLLILKADNPNLLILVTALLGALVGGLGALSGSFVRKPA